MTDYKTIRGKKIKFFTSDLSSAEAEGQIYYVNTSPGSVDTAGNFIKIKNSTTKKWFC